MSNDTPGYSARTADEYLRTRVDYKTEAYRAKGMRYRWGYLGMACTSAVAAATVPVLINLKDLPTIYPTLLSLLVTVLVGLEGILHFREHWKNYDLMKSFLRQEACTFQAGAGAYRGKTESEAFVLLVERVEEEISKERSQTIQMRTARSSEPDAQRDAARQETPRAANAHTAPPVPNSGG
jgi:Protein of unknown function (DUF4231)